jgi:hypothetical protein
VSYTLRGRLESRLAGAVAPLLAATVVSLVLARYWPLQLAGLMLGVGLVLDAVLYDRLLPYQAGWVALPLGVLELAVVMGLARALSVHAPLAWAVAFFAAAWLAAQVAGHAVLPLARLSYAEDGGELGRAGPALAVAAALALAAGGGAAWAREPPTYHLSAGVHQGPIVLDRAQTLVGEPGAIVRGGIVVRADHVTVRDVAVEGGEYGVVVDGARHVVLDRISVARARLDGIHVRRSEVEIRDCRVGAPAGRFEQGIDISFTSDLRPSLVEGCAVTGGQEGIVTHFAQVMLVRNWISGTSLRGLALTEMSMAMAEENQVTDGNGVGIFCGDSSICELERNVVTDVRPDVESQDRSRMGYGIVAQYNAEATLHGNTLRTPRAVGRFSDASVVRD